MNNNFWTTLPGILTGIGGVLASAGGLYQVVTTVGKPTTTTQPSIIVEARSDQGTPYRNPEKHTVKVNFKADGQWLAIPKDVPGDLPKGYISAKGAGDFSANADRRCPGFPLGALIVSTEQDQCLTAGDQGTFNLQPHQTAYFLMNDVKGRYDDNAGNVQVNLSLAKSE